MLDALGRNDVEAAVLGDRHAGILDRTRCRKECDRISGENLGLIKCPHRLKMTFKFRPNARRGMRH
jgi:hypothetical protein